MMLERLRSAWQHSDRLLGLLTDESWLEQPIALRQPFLFYLGHLPAFAWNQLGRGLLGTRGVAPELDTIFERGIDPTDVDSYDPQAAWPEREAVTAYRDGVRAELASALADPGFPKEGWPVVAMVIEHELMHQETLLYMLQELDHGRKRRPRDWPGLPVAAPARRSCSIEIPAGDVVLGAARGALPFGWDNEFPEHRVHVPAFAIDELPVTNADLLAFAEDGGYAEPRLWRDEDWAWRTRRCLNQPHAFRPGTSGLRVRGLLEDVPFERAASWPAMVSWAEARAFALWRGARLPTEAEWHRAARGTPGGRDRPWPWGDEPPAEAHGNFHFRHASPVPVGSHPEGASAWGVQELVGNGWEWTLSPFAPLPGFEPMPRYAGYSADFFDGRHFVLRGGSWATDAALLRPSFRNWFQPHYPYVFSKFRCARSL
jgi:ergothioneine biosynthesis protein EgtB